VRLASIKQRVTSVVLAICLASAGVALVSSPQAQAHAQVQEQAKAEELPRKAKLKVEPIYPEVARRMSIAGTVRLAVVVAPNGTVKSSKPIGGHPLLVNAATDAIRRWRFEPASTESSGIVEFKFQPPN
jgi:TonB family protein